MKAETLSLSHWGAFVTETENGRLTGVRPFDADPDPTPIIDALAEMVYSPLRIETPAVRKGYLDHGPDGDRTGRGREPFVPVGWDEALDLAAAELARVRTRHGASAIFGGSYGWSSAGRFHHARSQLRRFLFTGGGCVDQVTNYSWGAAQILLPHIVGTHQPVSGRNTSWDTIADHTDLFVAFGGLNPKNWQVTAGGAGTHMIPDATREAAKGGVSFVVVSPTADDIPDWLDAEWIAPRPNTDTAIMLAIAHTLIVEGLVDQPFLDRYTVGYEALRAYILGETTGTATTPEWAAAICDVPAETIRGLAHRMAAGRTYLTATWSLQRAENGEQPYWMLIALAAMLGGIGLPGGGYGFGHGSLNGVGNPAPHLPSPMLPTGRNPADLAIPVARIADLLLNPGAAYDFNGARYTYPDIRLVYWAGGNPFHHHQDLNRLETAWQRPETIIVNESWWTPTARRADIVFPATTTLERNDIGGSSRDPYLFAMKKVIEPVGEARDDAAIFTALAERLGYADAFTEGLDEMGWLARLYEVVARAGGQEGIAMPPFEAFWEAGLYEAPPPAEPDILHGAFRADPAANPLATPSGKIELYSEAIGAMGYADCPPHPVWRAPTEWLGAPLAARFPLHLISSQPARKLHSQLDPSTHSQGNKMNGREPAMINPADAEARSIGDGDTVRLFNERGATLATVRITETVRPGVVILQTGAWYDAADPASNARLERHGNPNALTRDKGTSSLGQGTSAMTTLVEIERFEAGEADRVTIFDPPRMAERGGLM
ncbi:molybdopterin-dependent oxidoreductase [Acuticoccus kandeliae]|uniref:molybdopterin-dependent oxidoreductase n=1 Tax=Acuticoccus kandeliae TaxID=2073160 RepID=UPI000D3E8780|nr:molybdopterin-dependent oxidoreductase [Acuticoccus kandeliae]